MATDQDRVRETLAAGQDQLEQITAQARQATREGFTVAQQTGQAVAQGAERLSEQGGRVATTALDTGWDSWLALLGTVSWSQDQVERSLRQMMDQGRMSREEGTRLLRDLVEQAKRNQGELQRLIQESVRAGLQGFQTPETAVQPWLTMMQPAANPMAAMFNPALNPMAAMMATMASQGQGQAPPSATGGVSAAQFDELNRKVDELTRKLDALTTSGRGK